MRDPADLPALLQSFFTTRLMAQRKVSPHTIASYRDTFRLLLQFAQKRLRKAPSQLGLDDLDASLIGAFLEDLENRRGNGARSRNLRLTAIRSFFRYASLEAPAHSRNHPTSAGDSEPTTTTRPGGFSDPAGNRCAAGGAESDAWLGRRDHAFLLTAVQTGLRLSEMTGLRHEDVSLGAGAHVHCHGKRAKGTLYSSGQAHGRGTKAWMREQGREDSKTLFPSTRGGRLSAVGVQHMVARHVAEGAEDLPYVAEETGFAPRASPRRGHGTAAGRRGSRGDCALART